MDYVFTEQEVNQMVQMVGEIPVKFGFSLVSLINGIVIREQEKTSVPEEKPGAKTE